MGFLCLGRRAGERVFIGSGPDRITVAVADVGRAGVVRLAILAPDDVPIVREELDAAGVRPGGRAGRAAAAVADYRAALERIAAGAPDAARLAAEALGLG